MTRFRILFPLLAGAFLLLSFAGCDTLVGTKDDDTADEIFDVGRDSTTFLSEARYVALLPFFTTGGSEQPLDAPADVSIGFDEFIYVADANGIHLLDQAGRSAFFLGEIAGQSLATATSVTQDRRFHVYVTARRDTTIDGRTWNLPVVYRLSGLTTGSPQLEDIIWHPFDDDSRTIIQPDPIPTDEDVEFTDVAILADNSIYVSRRGPVNDVTSDINPHNTIMVFTPDGFNIDTIVQLNPNTPGLTSAVYPSAVMTFTQPPQREDIQLNEDFLIAQTPSDVTGPLRYGVLSIEVAQTLDGTEYEPDAEMVGVTTRQDAGDGFLYEEFKFENPADLAYDAVDNNYIYVIDAGKDSLFVFTSLGIEGVSSPDPEVTTPVGVSFGGTGNGAYQFDTPRGIAFFDETVYVADTGNNRISRFRLNADFTD